ncbi:hypothetical protein AAZX31_11G162800 [Glycine max]
MTSYFVDTCVSKEVDMFISHSMSQNISQRYVLVQILAQNNNVIEILEEKPSIRYGSSLLQIDSYRHAIMLEKKTKTARHEYK